MIERKQDQETMKNYTLAWHKTNELLLRFFKGNFIDSMHVEKKIIL